MSEVLTVGSLFAGIGGFDLGLERAGMRVVWQCEQDEFCRRVLARHWLGVPCHPDVRALVADTERSGRNGLYERVEPRYMETDAQLSGANGADGRPATDPGRERTAGQVPVPVPYVDVLCGGFPCQDISLAGRGAGLAGERSGLWRHFARLISELRPRYVIVENVPALTSRGLDVVLGDLAACGFDAEWDHLPASAFGAPHRRDRIWLVAYPGGEGSQGRPVPVGDGAQESGPWDGGRGLADTDGVARNGARPAGEALPRSGEVERLGRRGSSEWHPWLTEPDMGRMAARLSPWLDEPDVGRVAVGVPQRVDRLRALGNALVPQIAEWIGRQIVEWEFAPLSPHR